jgi:NADPH:quinone reductase-like Zn-dependent oxidoreductase/acyl carrier protein
MVSADDLHAFRLATDKPGTFDGLSFARLARRKPGPGEVEIRVHTAGLNFIDVMKALGIYPGFDRSESAELGAECSGEVLAASPGVESLSAGDRVLLVTPSFRRAGLFTTHVIARSEDVFPIPDALTFEEAATIPIAFLTAHYGLNYLAHMKQGETVLIHSAAGGVGLAALQLAARAGANVIATAGNDEKRAYLRELGVEHVLDSRSTSFAESVQAITRGRGVDIVLNSLAGDALMAGMSVLAPGGRFVEIGKRDIYENSQMGMELFKNNRSFFAVDLASGLEQNRPFFLQMLREIMVQVNAGELKPLPSKTFSAANAADAFRHMAHGQNIGKVLVRFAGETIPVATSAVENLIRTDKTYWVTGGSGALGLLTAQWLARKGARSLVLSGRSGPSAEVQLAIEELEAAGVSVRAEIADVSNLEEVKRIVKTIQQGTTPLGGIFHAAGVLADGALSELDDERFLQALNPKVTGAWNLHIATRDLPLDVFVLFSSVSSLLGIPGQGNYAAGNAFLDALARYRRSQGLCATSIAWGPWAKVGLAAARSERGRRLGRQGLKSIPPQHGIAALEMMIGQNVPCVAVMSFDWRRWCDAHPFGGTSFFSELGEALPLEPKAKTFKQLLLEKEPGLLRREAMEAHLCEEIASVLQSIPARIVRNKPLKSMGFDSLLTLELRNRLERSLGIKFSPTLFWNYPTVTLLAPCLTEKMGIDLDEPVTTSPEADEPSVELDDLSETELAELLEKELGAANDLLRAGE